MFLFLHFNISIFSETIFNILFFCKNIDIILTSLAKDVTDHTPSPYPVHFLTQGKCNSALNERVQFPTRVSPTDRPSSQTPYRRLPPLSIFSQLSSPAVGKPEIPGFHLAYGRTGRGGQGVCALPSRPCGARRRCHAAPALEQ